jgi:folate-binding protein YgfZ
MLAPLPGRAVIEVSGDDRVSFLQGLVSNDVAEAAPGRAVWAALLTPQGKWLADFFILSDGERLLLDCEAAQVAMLIQRLTRFRLRAKVAVQPVPLLVYAAWGGGVPAVGIAAPDPRAPDAGWRVLSEAPLSSNATAEDWDLHRLRLGMPGPRDMEAEKTTLLEAGFDELHGVSWTKGCYMGQELTARTKYRGLLKRRLVPVRIDGPTPAEGTAVLRAGVEVGVMRSGAPGIGMVLLRLDAIGAGDLVCGDAVLHPAPPAWMQLEPIRLADAPPA